MTTAALATLPRRRKSLLAALLAAIMLFAIPVFSPVSSRAQMTPPAHHLNVIQRHPTMTAAAAAIATHSLLKRRAAYKKAHGERLNFAERHPTMSALAVGIVTHHYIKKHTPH